MRTSCKFSGLEKERYTRMVVAFQFHSSHQVICLFFLTTCSTVVTICYYCYYVTICKSVSLHPQQTTCECRESLVQFKCCTDRNRANTSAASQDYWMLINADFEMGGQERAAQAQGSVLSASPNNSKCRMDSFEKFKSNQLHHIHHTVSGL